MADTEKRSKERKIERQRKAEEEERKRKEIEAIQKMAPVIKIQEKVVEKIVEKVVEQDVIKEVRIGERCVCDGYGWTLLLETRLWLNCDPHIHIIIVPCARALCIFNSLFCPLTN